MHKIKPGTLTAGMVKNKLKELFVASDNAFSFFHLWVQSKEHQHTGKSLYDVLTMANQQLRIPTYVLTLPCADLRWEKLPHIINKLNNMHLYNFHIKILILIQIIHQKLCRVFAMSSGLPFNGIFPIVGLVWISQLCLNNIFWSQRIVYQERAAITCLG